MSRILIFFVLTVVIFGSLVWFVLDQGAKLEVEQNARANMGDSHGRSTRPA